MKKSLIDRARRGLMLGAAGALMLSAMPAQAAWPEKPVRIVLPFGAGGVADITARIVAEKLTGKLGERFVIENMPGPGGINAARSVATAQPDGYTLGLISNGTAISVATFTNLPFDPVKDFEPIGLQGQFDLVLVTSAKSEFKTLADFIKAAKASPGKMNIGTIAVGSTQNLGAELFKVVAGINAVIVPYKNSPDIVIAALRNDVQLLAEFPPSVQGQVASGELRILASSSSKRSALMPDVPTAQEQGVAGYDVSSWNGLVAPKGTPKEIIDTMNKALGEILAEKDVKDQFAKVGVEAVSGPPADLMKRLTDDITRWNAVVEKAGIQKK